jgi:hypothetical protein
MSHLKMQPLAKVIVLLVMAALAVPAVSSAAAGQSRQAPAEIASGHASVVRDCAWAQKQVRFALIRVKKINKRVRNFDAPLSKLKNARRIYHRYLLLRNQLCASNGGGQTPLALTESEVRARVNSQAYQYCFNSGDPYCYASGVWTDGGSLACESKSTYQWSCYGWNDEYDGTYYTCTFREIVSRSGYNGLTSYRDASYGSNGWAC